MKGKTILRGVLVAFAGAFVALFVYTRYLDNREPAASGSSTDTSVSYTPKMLTSMPFQEGLADFTFAAEQTVHAVVHVKTKSTVSDTYSNPLYEFFYGETQRQPREVRGYGSGVIVSSDGYIITNNHVIERADEVEVTLNDRRVFTADVIGRDPSTDIALLKVEQTGLPWVRYGSSDNLRLGEWVLAVGNPFNLTSTVTAGIVSAKGRSLNLLDDQYRIESFIQTDAALNMGNSGGALVNTKAELVGVTTAIISPSGAYAGNSFAVPVTIVRKVVEDLKEFGAVQRAIMGVNITDVTADIAEDKKLPSVSGVFISAVTPEGAAEEAGIKEEDIIVKVNDKTVVSTGELQEEIGKYRPGDEVDITIMRDGKELTYEIVLRNLQGGLGPVDASSISASAILGATFEPLSNQEKRRFRVESGVKVVEINDGRLSEIGIREDFVITEINGQMINSVQDIRRVTEGGRAIRSIEGYQPNGTFFSFQFRN